MRDDLNELKALIVAKMDVTEFLDLLGMELADLLDVLDDEIDENYNKLSRACR